MYPYSRNGLMAVLMVAGLALSGCGGSDGVSPSRITDLEAQIDLLEAQRKADEEARKKAEAEAEAETKAETPTTPRPTLADTAAQPGALPAQPEIRRPTTPTTSTPTPRSTTPPVDTAPQPSTTPELTQAEQEALNTRAITLVAALDTFSTDGPTPVIERPSSGLKVEITHPSGYRDGASPRSLSGWQGVTRTRSSANPAGMETVRLYTNIQAPAGKPFVSLYASHDTATGLVTVVSTDANEWDPELASSSRFPGVGRPAVDFGEYVAAVPDDPGTPANEAAPAMNAVPGSFHGVSGEFRCTTAPCTVGRNADNVPVFGGEWSFVTRNVNSRTSPVPDDNYIYFGYWLRQPDIPSLAHAFQPIHGGQQAAVLTNLTGSAEFKGSAAGMYVVRDQVEDTAVIGSFTADARLTATFGTGGKIDGVIDGFKDGQRELEGWLVVLGEATSLDDLTGITSAAIGGVTANGNWSGSLFGTDRKDGEPSGVAGQFDAFAGAAGARTAGVAGTFGAMNVGRDE